MRAAARVTDAARVLRAEDFACVDPDWTPEGHPLNHETKHLTMHGQGLSLRVSMLADLARHTAEGSSVEDGALAQRMQALGPNDVCSPLRALWVQGLGGTPGELLPDAAVATTLWAVNEHDRRLVPGGSYWPALALLPVRWMRLLVRVLRD